MDVVVVGVAALAVWRVAHFLHSEDGPWDAASQLRRVFAARESKLLECFFCVSVWPALLAGFLITDRWRELVLLWPALSGAAILIERAAFPDTLADVPDYREDKDSQDVLRPGKTNFQSQAD
jgi:hypothetical protein